MKCEMPNCECKSFLGLKFMSFNYGEYVHRSLRYCSKHTKKEYDEVFKELTKKYGVFTPIEFDYYPAP